MGLSSNFLPIKDGDYPMIETMTHVFICPRLVGRQLDLTALYMLIDRKNSGQGQMILISGEAGIGKSRLVVEAKIYAAQGTFCSSRDSVSRLTARFHMLLWLTSSDRTLCIMPRPP